MTALAFVAAATIGALLRHTALQLDCGWRAVLVSNVAGSALLGAVLAADISTPAATILGVGLCGSLTTFSSFVLEVNRAGRSWFAAAYAVVMVGSCCAAAAIAGVLVD